MQRQLETTGEHAGNTLVQYMEVNAILGNSPVEGTTTKEGTIYINETRRDNYMKIVTHLTTSSGMPVFFLEKDAYFVHFPHNDALVVTVHINCCKVSKILVDGGVASTSCTSTL